MKLMRKASVIVLVLALVLSSVIPTMAAGEYSASVSPARQTVSVGDSAKVLLSLGGQTTWSAGEFRFTYDSARLTFEQSASVLPDNCSVSDSGGSLTLRVYGAAKKISTALSLSFRVKATGEARVTLTAAWVDAGANACKDAPSAKITSAVAIIDCRSEGFTVSLPDWFSGSDTAYKGEEYVFTAYDKNYTYSFSGSTMGGESVTVNADADGTTFRIPDVSGSVIVQAQRTPRTVSVSISGSARPDITGANSATYMQDYSFTVNRNASYSYGTPEIFIGGTAFTGFTTAGSTYTIPGVSITGNIVIRVTRTALTPAQTVAVTVSGSGAGDVSGEATATVGEDYTFTVTKKDGYDYEIIVTMDGKRVAPKQGANGTYTIENVTGAISIRLTKTARTTVSVQEYVKLDRAKSIFLITVTGPAEDGQAYTYDGSVMYRSSAYGGWAWLVISGEEPETVRRNAPGKVSLAAAESTAISYGGDVNMSGTTDVNDAQLIWNMYNASYDSFGAMSMEKFLRADMNADGKLNVEDPAALLNPPTGKE